MLLIMMASAPKAPSIIVIIIAIARPHACILFPWLIFFNFYTPLARNDASCFCCRSTAAVSPQQDLQRVDDTRCIAVGVVGFNPNEALVTALGK